jgi:hypothetical protein
MLASCQNMVERMILHGHQFSHVEDYIDSTPCSADQKAALWLLAWSSQDRTTQRRVAKEALGRAAVEMG